ncbi:hypothetical protein Dsin_022810 [Dipteronia sinensis]|uniref:Uncharacterized protein n=1 Tax=Dipteronia sinensis TaxID=43782 RepID=A0AAE0A280_9ROSI|nr:hypothetical protein Dsin_022810 [Dipteronia sinensis]
MKISPPSATITATVSSTATSATVGTATTTTTKTTAICSYKQRLSDFSHYFIRLRLDAADVHCRMKKIDSPAYAGTIDGPAHAPCFKVRVTVYGHAFESPDFFKVEGQQSMLL